jgi:HlyD family secretion protein
MAGRKVYRVIGAAVVVAIAAAAYSGWGGRQDAPHYRFAQVERGTVTSVIAATGTLTPVVSVQVGSQVSGQILEISVDFNSPVRKGDVIARIDPDSFALRVNQAMADLEAARANVLTQQANVVALQADVARVRFELGDAERELKRNDSLHKRNFISAAVLEKSEAVFLAAAESLKSAQARRAVGESQVRNAEAIVRQREAQLAQARVDLDRTTIRAPVDGVVVKKSVEPGQTVAASLQAPELFVIAQDLREMQVETSIDEAEVGRVRVGQAATFTVDSFPGRTYRGSVTQVRRAALVVQNVVTYTAVISAANPNLALFPGMTANVRIVEAERSGVLKVANSALRYRPSGVGAQDPQRTPAADGPSAARKGGGGDGGEASRARLVKALELNAEQQARLEAIMSETRERIRVLDTADAAERRKRAARLREESRERIAGMLNPVQLARYESMAPGGGARGARGGTSAGRVWVLDGNGKPRAVEVRLGLTDGIHTELIGANEALDEGAQLIVGASAGGARARQTGRAPLGF